MDISVKTSSNWHEIRNRSETTIGRLTVIQDEIIIDGKAYPYTYEKISDSSCILGFWKNSVILIKEFRPNLRDWIWEIPGGVYVDESPEEAAIRELQEETGYVAGKMIYLGKVPVSVGTSTAYTHLYATKCVCHSEKKLDPTEQIMVKLVPVSKFREMILTNEFSFSPGIVAWYIYENRFLSAPC